MTKLQLFIRYSWLPVLLILGACQSPPSSPPEISEVKTSNPHSDITYDKTGMASWYGPNFQGKKTASGEIFDENELTAAHRTLPMNSLVRVTNLNNGRSVIVRINDRGPFANNRIIDLSRKAADDLGIHNTARVRVQLLPEETEHYLASQHDNGKTSVQDRD